MTAGQGGCHVLEPTGQEHTTAKALTRRSRRCLRSSFGILRERQRRCGELLGPVSNAWLVRVSGQSAAAVLPTSWSRSTARSSSARRETAGLNPFNWARARRSAVRSSAATRQNATG
jgi:hypothetical protein